MSNQYNIKDHLQEYFELVDKTNIQDNDVRIEKLISKFYSNVSFDHAALMDIIEEGGSSDDNIEISQSEIDRETYLS
jgi:hypothetical protein